VYFQVVEHYYPGRVMRQFGMAQHFPVPDAITKDEWYKLHRAKDLTFNKNWRQVHIEHVERLEAMDPQDMIPEHLQTYAFEAYDRDYRRWYQENCAFTVYMHGQISEMNEKPLEVRRDMNTEEYGYIPCGGPAGQIVRFNYSFIISKCLR
jgi:hypothetical protein